MNHPRTDNPRGTSKLFTGEFIGNRGGFRSVLSGGGMVGGIHDVEEGAPANLAS